MWNTQIRKKRIIAESHDLVLVLFAEHLFGNSNSKNRVCCCTVTGWVTHRNVGCEVANVTPAVVDLSHQCLEAKGVKGHLDLSHDVRWKFWF